MATKNDKFKMKAKTCIDDYNEQIESIKGQLDKADKAKQEKMNSLWNMVDSSIDRMQELWSGALAYEQAAEKHRLFVGADGELEMAHLCVIVSNVAETLDEIAKKYRELKGDPATDWENFLDGFCKRNCRFRSYVELTSELLVLDICQAVWTSLKRIPEFDEATNAEIDKMRKSLEEIERKKAEKLAEAEASKE